MNWTGARLRHHSKAASARNLSQKQRLWTCDKLQHQRLQQRTVSSPGTSLDNGPTICTGQIEPTYMAQSPSQHTQPPTHDIHLHSKSSGTPPSERLNGHSSDHRCYRPSSLSGTTFDNMRANLLKHMDWLGTSVKRPLHMSFTPAKEREGIGRQKQLPKEHLKPKVCLDAQHESCQSRHVFSGTFSDEQPRPQDNIVRRTFSPRNDPRPVQSNLLGNSSELHLPGKSIIRNAKQHFCIQDSFTLHEQPVPRSVDGKHAAKLPTLDTFRNLKSFDEIRQLNNGQLDTRCEAWLEEIESNGISHVRSGSYQFSPSRNEKTRSRSVKNNGGPQELSKLDMSSSNHVPFGLHQANTDRAIAISEASAEASKNFTLVRHGTENNLGSHQCTSSIRRARVNRNLNQASSAWTPQLCWRQMNGSSRSRMAQNTEAPSYLSKRSWHDAFSCTPEFEDDRDHLDDHSKQVCNEFSYFLSKASSFGRSNVLELPLPCGDSSGSAFMTRTPAWKQQSLGYASSPPPPLQRLSLPHAEAIDGQTVPELQEASPHFLTSEPSNLITQPVSALRSMNSDTPFMLHQSESNEQQSYNGIDGPTWTPAPQAMFWKALKYSPHLTYSEVTLSKPFENVRSREEPSPPCMEIMTG